MAKYRTVSTGSYGLKEETHYLYYASTESRQGIIVGRVRGSRGSFIGRYP